MNPKPRPSVKKKAAAKEAARAEKLAAKQQAQEARAAAKEARDRARQEAAQSKADAQKAASEEAALEAERNAEKIREIELRKAEEAERKQVRHLSPEEADAVAPTILASPAAIDGDIARFAAAAAKAHDSFAPQEKTSFDTQTIPLVDQEQILDGGWGQDSPRARKDAFSIPRGQTQEFDALEDGEFNAFFGDSPFFTSENVVGMKQASGYKRKRGVLHIIATCIGAIIAIAMLGAVLVAGTLTIKEYRPKDSSSVEISNPSETKVAKDDKISILTWDIGYCGLSDNASALVQGTTSARTASASDVEENLNAVKDTLSEQDVDVVFLQSVDEESTRSHKVNEAQDIADTFADAGYSSAFAKDYDVLYVPYPIPPIGKIDSGIMTETRLAAISAERVSVYDPLNWPQSLISPKPCVLVERLPIADSNKQLVLMNVHLNDMENENDRAQQAGQLALMIQREYDKGNYVIVGGDFSQSFSDAEKASGKTESDASSPEAIDAKSFGEDIQLVMATNAATSRSLDKAYSEGSSKVYTVDGFIVTKNIEVESAEVIDQQFKNSNHNPVKLVAKLK